MQKVLTNCACESIIKPSSRAFGTGWVEGASVANR